MSNRLRARCLDTFILLTIATTAAAHSEHPSTKHHVVIEKLCNIKVSNPYGGRFEAAEDGAFFLVPAKFVAKTRLSDLYLSAHCEPSENLEKAGVSFNAHTQKWERDFSKIKPGRDTPSKAMRFTVYTITAVNSIGYGVTLDDDTGEPQQRQRYFMYCLPHPPVALCGGGYVAFLNDPKGNLLPHIMRILRSVEFVESAP